MKVLVTGSTGQLGFDVVKYAPSKYDILAPSRSVLDISNKSSVESYLLEHRPDGIIHCAAWTKVDDAEIDTESCRKVNVDGTKYITDYCKIRNIPLIYISTDYVFNGEGNNPWKIDDATDPINEYGLSKLDGENIVRTHSKHYIVRISWVFGSNGNNFIKTMLNLSKKTDVVRVVNDQFGSPTYTVDLAPLLWEIFESEKYGTYHAHNEGYCNWYDVAKEIFEIVKADTTLVPITSNEYPMRAERPKNSRMDMSSIVCNGFKLLPKWDDAIKRFIAELDECM